MVKGLCEFRDHPCRTIRGGTHGNTCIIPPCARLRLVFGYRRLSTPNDYLGLLWGVAGDYNGFSLVATDYSDTHGRNYV